MLIDMRSMYIHKLEKGKFGSIVLKEIPAGGSVVTKVRPYDEALGTMLKKDKSVAAAGSAVSFGTEPGTTVASGSTLLASEQKTKAGLQGAAAGKGKEKKLNKQEPDLLTSAYKAIALPDDFTDTIGTCIVNALYFFMFVGALFLIYKKCIKKQFAGNAEGVHHEFDTDSQNFADVNV